jgi:hypothetical protein
MKQKYSQSTHEHISNNEKNARAYKHSIRGYEDKKARDIYETKNYEGGSERHFLRMSLIVPLKSSTLSL